MAATMTALTPKLRSALTRSAYTQVTRSMTLMSKDSAEEYKKLVSYRSDRVREHPPVNGHTLGINLASGSHGTHTNPACSHRTTVRDRTPLAGPLALT